MTWFLTNSMAFIGTPLGLILGWIGYSREKRLRPGVRTQISLIALSAASLSVALLGFLLLWGSSMRLGTDNATGHSLTTLGLWIGVLAAAIAFAGRVRILLPILVACVGSVLLWYGLTLG